MNLIGNKQPVKYSDPFLFRLCQTEVQIVAEPAGSTEPIKASVAGIDLLTNRCRLTAKSGTWLLKIPSIPTVPTIHTDGPIAMLYRLAL